MAYEYCEEFLEGLDWEKDLTAYKQDGQRPLTGQRATNFRRDLGAT